MRRGLARAAISLSAIAAAALGFFAVRLAVAPLPQSELRFRGDWPFEPDPELGFVAVANGETRVLAPDGAPEHAIYTDARRLRVEAAGGATPSRVDLLTVGGSFAWGHGLDAEETFTARLGRSLGLRVANAALAGYGGVQSLGALERHADLWPRVVVYAFIEDHLRRNLSPCAPSYGPFCRPVPHLVISADGRASRRPPDPSLDPGGLGERYLREVAIGAPSPWRALRWRARIDLAPLLGPPPRPPPDRRAYAPRDLEAGEREVLAGMARVARELDARLVVLHVPYLAPGASAQAPGSLRRALPAGASLVDLYPHLASFRRRRPAPSLTLPGDPHPSAEAHELMAKVLETALRTP